MKFKDKNGNIFIPTSKFLEDKMKQDTKNYTEIKANKDKENKEGAENANK